MTHLCVVIDDFQIKFSYQLPGPLLYTEAFVNNHRDCIIDWVDNDREFLNNLVEKKNIL